MSNFQKESPFLDELNHIIDTEYEMGEISDARHHDFVPNSTECDTWQKIRASHKLEDEKVTFQATDLFGMLILLSSGLGGSFLILTVELLIKWISVAKVITTLGGRY